jgi:hypothetical protein
MRSLILALILITTVARAEPLPWVAKPVLCTSQEAVLTFYREQGLWPLIGGSGKRYLIQTDEWLDTAYIILTNDKGSLAVMEYDLAGGVCSLAMMHNITYDTQELKGYLGIEDERY